MTTTITLTNQYGLSYTRSFDKKGEAINFLISEAKAKRKLSRIQHGLKNSVHSLPENSHQSPLVRISSFKINHFNVLDLLNNHWVQTYTLIEQ